MTSTAAALRAGLWLLVAAVLPPSVAAARAQQGTVPPPLQAKSEPIALAIAGQPAILRVVRANGAPEAALAAVESAWRQAGSQVRRDQDGDWRSVSRVDAQGIEALQLRAGKAGGSEGYLVRWQLSRAGVELARARDSLAHRLLPDVAVLLSDTASVAEQAGGGRTLVAWMPTATDTAARLLLARAESLGLRRQMPAVLPHTQFYTSADAEVALSLHTEGSGTALVIHLMETTR